MIGQAELALHNYRLFVSQDVEETRERISRVMQPHELRPIGACREPAHMDFVSLPGFGVGTIKFGRMGVHIDKVDDYHLLVFCLSGGGRFHSSVGDVAVDSKCGICLGPAEAFDAEFTEDCEQLVLRLDATTFSRYAGSPKARLNPVLRLERNELRPWLGLLNTLVSDAATIELLRSHPSIAADFGQLFLAMLVQGQGLVDDRAGIVASPRSVRRAEMFIDANLDSPLSLSEIAQAAQVAPRTLSEGFRRFRDTTPMRYLRERRMDRVRSRLVEGSDGRTVAQLALEAGFTHLGRFAHDYAARFGETPSATLARGRRAAFSAEP